MRQPKPLSLPMRIGMLVALLLWAALAFWTFSLGFSASYFKHDLPSRMPPFLAAFAGALALPLSAYHQWRRARSGASRMGAWLSHCACAGLCVLPLAGTAALLSRLPDPFHLSGDDAMGVGIVFLILVATAIVSAFLLGVLMLATHTDPTATGRERN